MSKKDFKRGVEAAIGANTAFMHKQAEATAELGKRIVQKIDEQGQIIDVILDTLNEQEKKKLYDLQSEYDIADLGENEKEVLASYLLTLISKHGQNSDYQKDYYFAVKQHLGVTDVSPAFDLSLVENVDSKSELKAMLKTVCEFLFLKTGETSFLKEFEDELDCFGLSRKVIREIIDSIETVYSALGLRGIVEHYLPAEKEENSTQSEETSKRVILDWSADKAFCLQNGVELDYWQNPKLITTRNCIVRNFPSINVESASLIDCVFENCDDIIIQESFVTNCEFKNIGYYRVDNTKISHCVFDKAYYNEEDDALFCLEDVEIDSSIFKNIKLTNNAYLFVAYGYCRIRNSEFVDVFTDRADMELYEYECSNGKGIFKITYQGTLIEKSSCKGLDMINVIKANI
jgi:hypothetical protein